MPFRPFGKKAGRLTVGVQVHDVEHLLRRPRVDQAALIDRGQVRGCRVADALVVVAGAVQRVPRVGDRLRLAEQATAVEDRADDARMVGLDGEDARGAREIAGILDQRAAPLYAVTPTSSKMKAARRKLVSFAKASKLSFGPARPAARAANVKARLRSMPGGRRHCCRERPGGC